MSPQGSAGAPEIEITAEMIQSGAKVLEGQLWEDALGGPGATNADYAELSEAVLRAALQTKNLR